MKNGRPNESKLLPNSCGRGPFTDNFPNRQMARGEPAGLDWNVIQRIDHLKKMKEELEKNGDAKGQVPNLEALLKAYRTRKLQWTGLITYWSKGKQLCEPRPFNWDEFEAINRKFDGHRAFWCEGVSTTIDHEHVFHLKHL